MRRPDSETPNAKRRHTSFLCFPQNVGKREVQLNEVNQDAFSLTNSLHVAHILRHLCAWAWTQNTDHRVDSLEARQAFSLLWSACVCSPTAAASVFRSAGDPGFCSVRNHGRPQWEYSPFLNHFGFCGGEMRPRRREELPVIFELITKSDNGFEFSLLCVGPDAPAPWRLLYTLCFVLKPAAAQLGCTKTAMSAPPPPTRQMTASGPL